VVLWWFEVDEADGEVGFEGPTGAFGLERDQRRAWEELKRRE
jgi:hypothetical protein